MDDVHAMDSQSVTVLTTLITMLPSLLIILGTRSSGPDCPQAYTLLQAAQAVADEPLVRTCFIMHVHQCAGCHVTCCDVMFQF